MDIKFVHRVDLEIAFFCGLGVTYELPVKWLPMKGTTVYELVQLSQTEEEYVEVAREFRKTCDKQIIEVNDQTIHLSFQFAVNHTGCYEHFFLFLPHLDCQSTK